MASWTTWQMSTRRSAYRRLTAFGRAFHCVLLLALAATVPAAAQPAVDLQLVLAVDASGSVDQVRFELQKRGYVAAFRHARVLQAIRSGPSQAIAVTMVQWTGPMLQVQVVGWTLIGDEESAAAFAAAIERAPRQLFSGGTSISGAIDHAMTLFPQEPVSRRPTRHRRLGRRLQQQGPFGHVGPRRGGRRRRRHQRPADSRARARSRSLLLRQRNRRPRRLRHRGEGLRDFRRRHPEKAYRRDRLERPAAGSAPEPRRNFARPIKL